MSQFWENLCTIRKTDGLYFIGPWWLRQESNKAFFRQRIPESSFARKKIVDIDILSKSRNGDRKIMQSIRIKSRSPSRKRKQNQLSQFWKTSTKVVPIEKTWTGHNSTMSQGFKRSSKWRMNSPAYSFLQLV